MQDYRCVLFMEVLGFELWSSGFRDKHFYLAYPSHWLRQESVHKLLGCKTCD
ncbi:rCG56640, isoform CRA_a [Rattus norvegicus]|uniref:RCG56640, isoform CRA_a n=1 Tax=Rattus norvegicus TaxID=10116 RepID=A6KEP6_RAT|nr:rCG56640, isoform CRA_a [Rattus norvegicus]